MSGVHITVEHGTKTYDLSEAVHEHPTMRDGGEPSTWDMIAVLDRVVAKIRAAMLEADDA